MKVLHVISEMGAGGAESLVAEMVRRGSDNDWRSGLASSGGLRLEALQADVAFEHYLVRRAGRTPQGVLRAVNDLARAIRAFDPDLVIGHNVGSTLTATLALGSRRRRVPIITVFHGVSEGDYVNAARILSMAPRHVVTVSEAIARRLREAGLSARVPITVVPNAISAPLLRDKGAARTALGLDAAAPVALCLARMVEQKRHDVLLDAWARVREGAVLLLAGDGPLRAELESRARELQISDRVRFLGVRSDVPDLLSAADITCLSSDWEGLPIAVLESMAAGRPVVATDVDGVAEAVGQDSGLIVPRRDPERLAEALTTALFDVPAREDMAVAALQRIQDRHDPAVMMRTYADLAQILLAERGRGR